MPRGKKIDWIAAKSAYVGDKNMSLKAVAERFNASYDYVRQVAIKEGWTKEKDKRWDKAEKDALEEVEGTMKDLIIRHAKVARYLQAAGLKYLKFILDEVEEKMRAGDDDGARKLIKQLIYNKIITAGTLMGMVSEGLKAERELYPKQMQVSGGVTLEGEGLSPELEKVVYDAFKRELIERSKKEAQRKNRNRKATTKK